MDYAPGFEQYQTPENVTEKAKRSLITSFPYVLKAIANVLYWVIKLIRDFLRDAFNSVLGR